MFTNMHTLCTYILHAYVHTRIQKYAYVHWIIPTVVSFIFFLFKLDVQTFFFTVFVNNFLFQSTTTWTVAPNIHQFVNTGCFSTCNSCTNFHYLFLYSV